MKLNIDMNEQDPIDYNIKRFCAIISEINSINNYLDEEKGSFYYGGHSFEECYAYDIEKLVKLQDEFKSLFKKI